MAQLVRDTSKTYKDDGSIKAPGVVDLSMEVEVEVEVEEEE